MLTTNFCGLEMKNPLVLASGILSTTGASLARVAKNCGAVTTKSIWFDRHDGHANPTVVHLGGGNFINAVGLPHGGINEARHEIGKFRELSDAPLLGSIAGNRLDEYEKTVSAVAELQPEMIELNISCPNVEDEFGKPFACDVSQTERATAIAKKAAGGIPLAVKLSPNVANIGEIALAAEAAGADAIVAINTAGPGMIIDVEFRKPILKNKVGGLSGPAIRPIAVKAVFDIFSAVKIPILGMGGVSTGRDAVEMILAGATTVGVGSAAVSGFEVFGKIANEMEDYCRHHNLKNISEIRGAAHES